MKVKNAFQWNRSCSCIPGGIEIPAGTPIEYQNIHGGGGGYWVDPSFFQDDSVKHDAVYYGCRVAPENVDHEGQALSKEDYAAALGSQTACNLGALIHSFDRVIIKLQYEARIFSHGTDWINQHPITRLYAEQIAFLSSPRNYSEAANICETNAKE